MRKRKKDTLTASELFTKVSERANYLNEEVVREVYYELVRVLVHELRTKKAVKMPDFGEFRITLHKERRARDANTKEMITVPACHTVKYKADYKLKNFFKKFGGDDREMENIPKK